MKKKPKRRPVTKEQYAQYLRTPQWHTIRRAVLERDGHVCRACQKPAVHVHHRRYPRVLGREKMDWLYSLCRACHAQVHKYVDSGMKLRAATDLVLGTRIDGKITVLPYDPWAGRRQIKKKVYYTRSKKPRTRSKAAGVKKHLIVANDELHEIQLRARENRNRRRKEPLD